MKDLEKNWSLLIARLEKQFDYDITLRCLYLIGYKSLICQKKALVRRKVDILHIATVKFWFF